ncbi:MAG: hypothetical protein TECD_00842 [Hyphomicrobiaceae bacterium hypho_1]
MPHFNNFFSAFLIFLVILNKHSFSEEQIIKIDNDLLPTLSVGTTISIAPRYEGSSNYKSSISPFLFPNFSGPVGLVDFRGIDDIRLKLLQNKMFELGPLFGYRIGRHEDDCKKLKGLGNIDDGLVLGGFMRASLFSSIYASLSLHHLATGDKNGSQLRFGLEYEIQPITNASIIARMVATYADEEHMGKYFGITEVQHYNSGGTFRRYNAEAGIKDFNFSLGGNIKLYNMFQLNLIGRYARLIGHAADSPIVDKEDQFSASFGLVFNFKKFN